MSVYDIEVDDWQRPGWSESKDDKDAPPLSTVAIDCQKGISDLLEATKSEDCCVKDILGVRDVEHIQERYDQWAGNLGALQHFKSPLSLAHRLRDAFLVRDSILSTLTDFLTSLQNATDIATGRRPNRVAPPLDIGSDIDLSEYDISSSESDSSSVQSSSSERNISASTSELHELTSAMNIGLDSLFKASIFVRKFAPKDKRLRAAKAKPFDNRADIMYVNDRYPVMAKKNPALAVRLGEANARRRQYFKYCRDHNERLSTVVKPVVRHLSATPQNQPQTTTGSVGPAESVFTAETKPSWFTETEATEFVADAADQEKILEINRLAPAMSVVSFATSIAETSDDELPFPPVPKEARNGAPFQCPYCLTPQQLRLEGLERQWRKHILKDLEPYSCTFPSCGLDSFQSQHAWFEHELLAHRCQWVCPECSDYFWLSDSLKAHISRNHSGVFSKLQLSTIADQSKRPISSVQPNECPFCDEPWAEAELTPTANEEVLVVTLEQFRRHLGHHMQQVALFALPRLDQTQSCSVGSADANNGSTQSDMSTGFRWIRDDCGRGWSIISRKRVIFSAFSHFLKRYVPRTTAEYHKYLKNFIDRNLGTFGFTEDWIARLAYRAPRMADDLKLEYELRDEEAAKLIRLSLFDIFVFCDNTGTTNLDNSRQAQIQTLKSIIYWATGTGMDGIYLRFLHSDQDTNGNFDKLTDPNTIDDLFGKVDIGGDVKLLGTALDDKVLAPFVQDVAKGRKRGELVKPRITLILTESEPIGEERGFMAKKMMMSTMNEYLYDDSSLAKNFILSLLGDREQAKKYYATFSEAIQCKFEPLSGLEQVMDDLIQREGELGYTKYVMRLFISTIDSAAGLADWARSYNHQWERQHTF